MYSFYLGLQGATFFNLFLNFNCWKTKGVIHLSIKPPIYTLVVDIEHSKIKHHKQLMSRLTQWEREPRPPNCSWY